MQNNNINFKIQIAQKDFLKIILVANSITEGKNTGLIGAIKIIAKDNYIKIIAQNNILLLEQKIITNTNAVIIKEGEIVMQTSILLSIIKIFNNKIVTIFSNEDMIYIESDAKFKINKISDGLEFFSHDINLDIFHIKLSSLKLASILKYTKFAIATHESRANLNCIAIKSHDNKIIAYGMDGHRFARFESSKDLTQEDYQSINIIKDINIHQDQGLISNNLDIKDQNAITNIENEHLSNEVPNNLINLQNEDEYFAKYKNTNLENDDTKTSLNKQINNFLDFKVLLPIKLVEEVLSIISIFKMNFIYININTRDITLIFSNEVLDINKNKISSIKDFSEHEIQDNEESQSNNNLNMQNITNLSTPSLKPKIYNNDYVKLKSKLINAEFIDYDKIIPNLTDYKYTYKINAAILHENINKVTAISNEKFKALKCIFFNSSVEIMSYGQNDAKATIMIDIENISNQNPDDNSLKSKIQHHNTELNLEKNQTKESSSLITIGFNYRYLLDVLDILKDHDIQIHIKNNLSPIIIKSITLTNAIFIIMPIKI